MGSIKGVPRGKYSTRTMQITGRVHCWKCHKSFKRRPILAHHIRSKHLKHAFSCPICSKQFISKSNCRRHMKNVHQIMNDSEFKIEFQPSLNTSAYTPGSAAIDFETHEAFPNMAAVLKMKEDKKFGKHLVTQTDLAVGQVVLAASPFAFVEYVMAVGSGCFNCGAQPNGKFIQCEFCINIQFCSKRCSLTQHHHSKCDRMFNRNDCREVRLATKLILNVISTFPDSETMLDFSSGILFSNKKSHHYLPPFSQYGEILQLTGKMKAENVLLAKRVRDLIMQTPQFQSDRSQETKRILYYVALRHLASIATNTFSEEFAVSKGGVHIRFFIFDAASRINHSCTPNIHHYIDPNDIMHFVVLRPIKSGDQLFINYLNSTEPAICDRKAYFKEDWMFECQCNKCNLNNFVGNNSDPSYEYIKRNRVKCSLKSAMKVKNECVKYLQKFGYTWSISVEFVVNCLISIINDF